MADQLKSSSVLGSKLLIKISSRSLIITGAVAMLLVVGGVGFWYWSKNRQAPSLPTQAAPSQTPETPTLGSEIFEKTQNQLKGQVPDSNPFKDQKNPLDSIYQNPFE